VIQNGNKYTESPRLTKLIVGPGKIASFETKFVFSQITNSTGTVLFKVCSCYTHVSLLGILGLMGFKSGILLRDILFLPTSI
jgi:hypothetical protein